MFRLSRKMRSALVITLGLGISICAIAQRRRLESLLETQPTSIAEVGYQPPLPLRIYDTLAQEIDHKIGWSNLPRGLGLATLFGLRNILRQHNLYDTTNIPSVSPPFVGPLKNRYLTTRTLDGTYNDLRQPRMGMAGSRFGRNVPIKDTVPGQEPAILTPNPRTISRELLTRETFQPAPTLNMLAAAWIQFMIRDWFSHDKTTVNPWKIDLSADDPWRQRQNPMLIMRTKPDETRGPDSGNLPPTYLNTQTHWWDASQLYGSDTETHKLVRLGKGGKLIVGDDGLLKIPADPAHNPTLVPGWWIGQEMMQTLFVREHNAICDRLQAEYPTWDDEEIFDRARLITAALLAKIHTVEWTPAIISHPTTQAALRANWWGLEMQRLHDVFGRISDSEVISGIPGSQTDNYGIPYSLTEEFVAVYKMHPLIRDDFSFRSATDGKAIQENTLDQVTGPQAHALAQKISMTDLFYSFGTLNPGALALHNYPRFLQDFTRPDGIHTDLAATDIMRSRELGVPRYNKFRELLHLPPAKTFEDITDNQQWAEEMRSVYNDDIDQVDLMVGMFAERLPHGFAFSDTAFRIFILMASRRLNSDRFFTTDFTPQIYTPVGMEWIKNNTMISVLLRHYPELQASLRTITNAFVPWGEIGDY